MLIGASALACFASASTSQAANVLSNPNFESGAAGWSTYSPVTWGNIGVNSDYSKSSANAFWARGSWNAQNSWQGAYQKVVSAPDCAYQASGFIFSPSGYGTRGDIGVGDFGWIGIDGTQNYAWLEVSFRNSANAIIALYKSAVFDSTSPQSTWVDSPVTLICDVNNNNAIIGSTNTLVAPAGTVAVQFQLVFQQANWNHGAAWFDNMVLNQIAGPVPPAITGVTPNGAALFNSAAQNFTFQASSTTTDINPGGIKVTVNGKDVSSQLVISGSARDRIVNLPLKTNQVYSIVATVTDAVNFTTTANALFDTFNANSYTWEAEDYNFNGGQFYNTPVLSAVSNTPNSYFEVIGIPEIDYHDTQVEWPVTDNSAHKYRSADFMATETITDIPRQQFVNAGVADYKVGWFNGGEWVNYTRNFPVGKFNIYARVDGGAGTGIVDLARVTSGATTTNQTTVNLGTFTFTGRGWSVYDWVALTDSFGNPVAVDMGGLATLRATTRGGADLLFFMLVPAALDNPVIGNIYPNGSTLYQATNKITFTVTSPSTAIMASGIQLTLNGTDVSSQLAVTGTSLSRTVSFPGLKTNQSYVAEIAVTDVNGNQASSTVRFDTFSPSFAWEAEDFNYNGGMFLDNAPINGYAGLVGVQGVDENETDTGEGAGPAAAHQYRTIADPMATGTANDVPRTAYVNNPSLVDYAIGYFHSGEWVNYTRTIPAGNYNIYGRISCGNASGAIRISTVNGSQATSLGTCTVTGRGWSSYDFVPLRDDNGNLVEANLSGLTTLRATCINEANINFFVLVPARMDLPRLTGISPDGTTLLQRADKLVFTANNPTVAINSTDISVTLNGQNVSSQLVLTGSPNNWNVTLPGLLPNATNYTAVIKVTDNNGVIATKTVSFDTFSANDFSFEAEDFDFDGGQFIDNPAVNAYRTKASVPDIDETYLVYDGNHDYRANDFIATQVCGDKTRQAIIAAQAIDPTVTDYNLGWWHAGSWINYTRTYPAGNYQVWGRLGGNSTYNVQLDNIVAGVTNHLGTFRAPGRGWGTWDFVPLKNASGQNAVIALGGVSTLRTTTDGNANANFFILVPYVAPATATAMTASRNGSSVALSFSTQAGFNYQVVYKNDLSDSTWTPLTTVSGNGSVKTVTDSLGSKRFYRLVIQ